MKRSKLLLIIIVLFLVSNTYSQIVIDTQNMVTAGVYTISTDQNITFIPDSTGQNYIWDFSNLQRLTTKNDTLLTVNSAPYVYQATYNNPFDQAHKATVVQNTGNQSSSSSSPIQITNNYDYLKNSSTIFSKVGAGSDINGVPTVMKYDNAELYTTNFPLTYNDSVYSVSESHMDVPNIGYYGKTVYRTNTVDGYGTVSTPFGTFNAIRVKSIINEHDTIYYDSYSTGFAFDRPEILLYTWYSDTQSYPVLAITKRGSSYSAVYRDSANLVSANTNKSTSKTFIYPTITNDIININIESDKISTSNISIFNLNGQLITQITSHINAGETKINISLKSKNIKTGQYIIVNQFDNNINIDKIILVD